MLEIGGKNLGNEINNKRNNYHVNDDKRNTIKVHNSMCINQFGTFQI